MGDILKRQKGKINSFWVFFSGSFVLAKLDTKQLSQGTIQVKLAASPRP